MKAVLFEPALSELRDEAPTSVMQDQSFYEVEK